MGRVIWITKYKMVLVKFEGHGWEGTTVKLILEQTITVLEA